MTLIWTGNRPANDIQYRDIKLQMVFKESPFCWSIAFSAYPATQLPSHTRHLALPYNTTFLHWCTLLKYYTHTNSPPNPPTHPPTHSCAWLKYFSSTWKMSFIHLVYSSFPPTFTLIFTVHTYKLRIIRRGYVHNYTGFGILLLCIPPNIVKHRFLS